MAFITASPSGLLAQQQQIDLERRKQSFLEQQAAGQDKGFAGDVLDALKEGISLANNLTGIQANLAKIDELKAQTGLTTMQQQQVTAQAEAKARQAAGVFQSPLEVVQAGYQIGTPDKKYSQFETPIQAKVGGQEVTIFKPLEASQKVELAKKESDVGIKRMELDLAQKKDAAQKASELANNEKELRKEYNAHPQIKEFAVVNQNYNQVVSSAKKPNPSGADDLKLVVSYIKILDPNSVVREGEITNVTKSSGLIDQAIAQYNRVKGGGTLDTNIRSQILNSATDAYAGALNTKQDLDSWYASIAQKKGFDLTQVLPKQALMSINIQAPDLPGSGTVMIPEAQAAAPNFNPDLFIQSMKPVTSKTVPKAAPKVRGPGILGGR